LTKVGLIGIKVWICRGEVYGKRDLAPSYVTGQKEGSRTERRSGDHHSGGDHGNKNSSRRKKK